LPYFLRQHLGTEVDPRFEPKYSVSCLIPKNDKKTLLKINAAVEAAKEEAKGKKWAVRFRLT
jgi:hypothetical protein